MYRVKGADQKEYGPVSADQVLQWIQENRLNRHSLIQKEGDPAWKPLDQFPEFTAALGAGPAPAAGIPVYPPPSGPTTTGAVPVYTPVADPQRAASAVKGPAIALLLIGVLGILFSLAGLAAKPRMMEAILIAAQNANVQMPQEQIDRFRAEQARGIGAGDYAQVGLSLVLYALVIAGALKMQQLENWGLALAAAIIAMLPCTCCCCAGIFVGIWAVIVLNRPEVKASFR